MLNIVEKCHGPVWGDLYSVTTLITKNFGSFKFRKSLCPKLKTSEIVVPEI